MTEQNKIRIDGETPDELLVIRMDRAGTESDPEVTLVVYGGSRRAGGSFKLKKLMEELKKLEEEAISRKTTLQKGKQQPEPLWP